LENLHVQIKEEVDIMDYELEINSLWFKHGETNPVLLNMNMTYFGF
jgi:hypothetical protein